MLKVKHMMRRAAAFGWLALVTLAGCARADDFFYLNDGDRVVFFGDSITEQLLYTNFAEAFTVQRFPQRNITFVHSGWSGDRVSAGDGGVINPRLERDILAYKPTVVTVMLGMNDGEYRAFDQRLFNNYSKGYQNLVDKLKKEVPGIRMTLIVPSPFDDVTRPPTFEGGYNKVLLRYGEYVKELAAKEKLDVADLNTGVVVALQAAKKADAAFAEKINPDRVHPAPAGHLLMALELLKAWNAPDLVTSVEIDAAAGKLVASENTIVTDFKGGANLSWTQTDKALPFQVANMKEKVTELAINSSDFTEALNQQPLTVIGLAAATYDLKIDGTSMGKFSKEQLAAGVNLALLPTPMAAQSLRVYALTVQHNLAHFTRWRNVQHGYKSYKLPATTKALADLATALDAEEEEIVKIRRTVAQPVPHNYELVAQ